MITYEPSSNIYTLHFQCDVEYNIEEITNKINNYIKEHRKELVPDQTALPIYLMKFKLIKADLFD